MFEQCMMDVNKTGVFWKRSDSGFKHSAGLHVLLGLNQLSRYFSKC